MVLETAGIGLVIPALAVIVQDDIGARYPLLAPFLAALGNPTQEQLIVMGMLLLLLFYAVKTAFLAFVAWRQMWFVHCVQSDLAYRLFYGCMYQPYSFHLQRNSAELVHRISNETNIATQAGLMPMLNLFTEFLVLVGVSVLLLAVEPLGALLVVAIIGLSAWAIAHLPRNMIARWGEAYLLHSGGRLQHLQQGLGSAKDAKLLGREADFLAQFQRHNRGMARVSQRQLTLQQLPRLMLELLAVTALAAVVIVMVMHGKPLEKMVPILGLFSAAAFRFLPSAQRAIYSLHSVRYALPVIESLYKDLPLFESARRTLETEPLPLGETLTFENVSFTYASGDRPALHDVSFAIAHGSAVGFVGASGAGKSTVVDVLLGLLAPTSGAVKVDGIDIQTRLRGWQDQIGYVPQSIYLTDDTLRRNVAFGLPNGKIDDRAVMAALRAAQLDGFVAELPQGLETEVGERGIRLSGGQRQRIGIARALYHNPSVLVLDEATSALDTETEAGVMEAVQALHGQKTIIIVAHRLTTVRYCDCIFRFDKGRLVSVGAPAAVPGVAAAAAR
jgi:ABC-type multidrug transport system fused ATPase/permease subunit